MTDLTVAFIGLGLIGGSIARALKQNRTAREDSTIYKNNM